MQNVERICKSEEGNIFSKCEKVGKWWKAGKRDVVKPEENVGEVKKKKRIKIN